MSKLMSDIVKMASELVLFGVVVLFIVLATTFSNELHDSKIENDNVRKELNSIRELYAYDNRVLTGDDILILMTKYSQNIEVSIQLGGSGSTDWLKLTPDSSELEWEANTVKKVLGNAIRSKYIARLDKDMHGTVKGVVFWYA